MAYKKGNKVAGSKSCSDPHSGKGSGGGKRGKYSGAKTSVKKATGKKPKQLVKGSGGSASPSPKRFTKNISTTRTPYNKQTPGVK